MSGVYLLNIPSAVAIFLSWRAHRLMTQCCYERKGFTKDMRGTVRVIYVLPTVFSCLFIAVVNLSFLVGEARQAGCALLMFVLMGNLVVWTLAMFIKTSRLRPVIHTPQIDCEADFVTLPTRHRGAGRAGTSVGRHAFADPADGDDGGFGTEMVDLQTGERARVSSEAHRPLGDDDGTSTDVNVFSLEEAQSHRAIVVMMTGVLLLHLLYAAASRNMGTLVAVRTSGCKIMRLETLSAATTVMIFTPLLMVTSMYAWTVSRQDRHTQICRRGSMAMLGFNAAVFLAFATGGGGGAVDLLIVLSFVCPIVMQSIWVWPYLQAIMLGAEKVEQPAVRPPAAEVVAVIGDPAPHLMARLFRRRKGTSKPVARPLPRRKEPRAMDDIFQLDFQATDSEFASNAAAGVGAGGSEVPRGPVSHILDDLEDDEEDDDDDEDEDDMPEPMTRMARWQQPPSDMPVEPARELRGWDDFVADKRALVFLRSYLVETHRAELVDFLINVDIDLTILPRLPIAVLDAIEAKYIAPDGEAPVNISAEARADVQTRMATARTEVAKAGMTMLDMRHNPFAAATREVATLVQTSVLADFQQSPQFRMYARGEAISAEHIRRYATPGWMLAMGNPWALSRPVTQA